MSLTLKGFRGMKVWPAFLFLFMMTLTVMVWNMSDENGFYVFLLKGDVKKVGKSQQKTPLRPPLGMSAENLLHGSSSQTESKHENVPRQPDPLDISKLIPHVSFGQVVSHDDVSHSVVNVSHNHFSHSEGQNKTTESHEKGDVTKEEKLKSGGQGQGLKPNTGNSRLTSTGSAGVIVSVEALGTTTVSINITKTLALTTTMSPSPISNVSKAAVGTGSNSTDTPYNRTMNYVSTVSGYDSNDGVVVKLALGDYTKPNLDVLPQISFTQTGTVDGLPLCSQKGREELSDAALKVNESEMVEADVLRAAGEGLLPGGIRVPTGCKRQYSVALLIPFRDRGRQVFPFLFHMHKFLRKQNVLYQIFFIEQADKEKFNRGTLMNIGFKVSQALGDFNCVVLTDIDLIPIMEKHRYDCVNSPKHMSAYMDSLHDAYKGGMKGYFLNSFFGGVSAMTAAHYQLINGFSNRYFGWGGEDDDLHERCLGKGLKVHRYIKPEYRSTKKVKNPPEFTDIARYHALHHKRRSEKELSNDRFALLGKARKRMNNDGLSDLSTYYHLDSIHIHKMYVWVRVTLHNPRKVV